jgi:type II secretory ATPase GspE/PulE/Tfp pilus assembly ATPase PilB-like protein
VAELWTPGDAEFLLITKGASLSELRDAAKASTVSMVEDVSEKLVQGRTNVEELLRTLPYSSLYEMRRSSCFGVERAHDTLHR